MSPIAGNLRAMIRDSLWLQVTPVQFLQRGVVSFQLRERVGRVMVRNSSNARLSCEGSAFAPEMIRYREKRVHRESLHASIAGSL